MAIMSIIYAGFVPGFFIILFLKNRKDPGDPKFRHLFGALVSPYKLKYFYWELILMLKRGSFIIVNQLGSLSANYLVRFGASVCILAMFGAIEVIVQPYSSDFSNLINCTWNIILIMVLLCQGLIFQPQDSMSVFTIFGIFIISIVTSTVFILVIQTLKKFLFRNSGAESLVLSKLTLNSLPDHIKRELLVIYSEEKMKKNGNICLQQSAGIVSEKALIEVQHWISPS
jgi:hypothetical protein